MRAKSRRHLTKAIHRSRHKLQKFHQCSYFICTCHNIPATFVLSTLNVSCGPLTLNARCCRSLSMCVSRCQNPSPSNQENARRRGRRFCILHFFNTLRRAGAIGTVSHRTKISSEVTPLLSFKRPESFWRLMPTRRSRQPRRNCGCLNSCHASDSAGAASAPAAAAAPRLVNLGRDDAPPLPF